MEERAYKYRFYPTSSQVEQLAKTFGCVRWAYNQAFSEKQDLYKKTKENLSYYDLCKKLTSWRAKYDWLKNCSSVATQQSLKNLEKSYTNFLKGITKFPKFKNKDSKQSIKYTKDGFSWNVKTKDLKLAKMKEPLKIKWSRHFEGKPSSITVLKDCRNRYFISFLVKEEIQKLPKANKEIGIDLGLSSFLITDKGEKIEHPKFLDRSLKKLKRRNQDLSRKKKGSSNRRKAKYKLARFYGKITDRRNDFLHKLSSRIVNENQVINSETLKIKNMMKNRRLSKAIGQSGWGDFLRQLEYKSRWYGRTFTKISQWYPSSKLCSNCNHKREKLKLSTRTWKCEKCQVLHDRDINAAKNILAAGQAERQNACGGRIRPVDGISVEAGTTQLLGIHHL